MPGERPRPTPRARLARGYRAIRPGHGALASVPTAWRDKPIPQPGHNPSLGARPLPYIHDLVALAYLSPRDGTAGLRKKVDAIAAYVADERYRTLPRGYGYASMDDNPRFYYACGRNVDLPDPGDDAPLARRALVRRVELLSRFPATARSARFGEALRFLGSFATGRGTWLFPGFSLEEKKNGHFVGGSYMG